MRTKRFIKCTGEKWRQNPARSVGKLAAEAHVSPSTMHRLLKENFKVRTNEITTGQLLSDNTKKKRLERAKLIFQKLVDDMQPQDGVTSHTARTVQIWCKNNFNSFWSKELWPPSSPDLNPMDFGVWSILEQKARTASCSRCLKEEFNKNLAGN